MCSLPTLTDKCPVSHAAPHQEIDGSNLADKGENEVGLLLFAFSSLLSFSGQLSKMYPRGLPFFFMYLSCSSSREKRKRMVLCQREGRRDTSLHGRNKRMVGGMRLVLRLRRIYGNGSVGVMVEIIVSNRSGFCFGSCNSRNCFVCRSGDTGRVVVLIEIVVNVESRSSYCAVIRRK